MTVLLRSGVLRLCAGAAALLALAPADDAAAQRGGGVCNQPLTILVGWPRAESKVKSLEVRDKVWSALKDFGKGICLVSKQQSDEVLKGSQFPIDSTLGTSEMVQLGNQLRADVVLELAAKSVGKSYELSGRIVLVRDERLRDSLPKIPVEDLFAVGVKLLEPEMRKVNSQIPHVEKCFNFTREEKYAEAEAAGRAGLAAYPGNISRLCIATALREGKKNLDQVIALSEEVRKTDPENGLALLHLLNTYLEQNNNAKYAEIATIILTKEPGHRDAETIITNLAAQKQTDVVIKLLEKSLLDAPDDLGLRRLEFRVVNASEDLKLIQRKAEELAKIDTASVDTTFVMRVASAYLRDSVPNKQLEKAGEWYARGTQKFPQNQTMSLALAQILRSLGQHQQAIAEYQRLLKVNPRAPVRLYIADAYEKAGQPDSAYAWVRQAAASPEERNQAAALVTTMGMRKINAAQASKTIDDWKGAITTLAYADSLNPADRRAAFYWGVAAFQTAYNLYQKMTENGGRPTCEGLKEVNDYLLLSNEKVRAGATIDATTQQTAATILTNFGTMLGAVEQAKAQIRPPC